MKIDTCAADFLEDGFRYASHETRARLADAFYALLHDAARTLEGNTAETDLRWIAKRLSPAYDALGSAEQLAWDNVALAVLELLPDYQMRVAARMMQMAKVTGEIAKGERKSLKLVSKEPAQGEDNASPF